MKDRFFSIYALLLTLLFSCTEYGEPEVYQYPMIRTLEVTDISSSGATFNAEFLNIGYDDVIQYGFVFDTENPTITVSDTLAIQEEASKGVFSTIVIDGLAGNTEYFIKAFAVTGNHIIYGNMVHFQSQGSLRDPWEFILEPPMNGWGDIHSISNNETGFILFQSAIFYSYDPVSNTISRLNNIPISGSSGTYYASFILDNFVYILTNASGNILRYDIENDQWTSAGSKPFTLRGFYGYFGFSIHNTGYFISGDNFYSYNQVSGSWTQRENIPSTFVNSVQVIGDYAYVFTGGRAIYKYNPANDSWGVETYYPGIWNERIVSFAFGDNLYYGLSYFDYDRDGDAAQDFWQYSTQDKEWKKVDKFPLKHSQAAVFAFSIGNEGFLGYYKSIYEYNLWKFSEEKILE